jgi:hypothetical protein
MIYLYASSSNEISLIPSQSFSSGEEMRLVFTNRFSEATSSVSLNVTSSGDWIKAPLTLPTDIDLKGGSYDLVLQKITGDVPVQQVWGTSTQVYSTSTVVWSVGTAGGGGEYTNDTTTTAFVSESIGRTLYTSANENGVFVVYEG